MFDIAYMIHEQIVGRINEICSSFNGSGKSGLEMDKTKLYTMGILLSSIKGSNQNMHMLGSRRSLKLIIFS